MLRLTQTVGAERQVSAFVPVLANAADTLLPGLRSATMVRVSLTNGTPIVTLGYAAPFDQRKADTDFISAQSFAGEIPLRAEAAVPFGTVRADYANLDVSFTVVAGIYCFWPGWCRCWVGYRVCCCFLNGIINFCNFFLFVRLG